ncbi:Fimbrial assembly protein PilQ [Crenothrix polyspora]|uniref:Fimbrial assembly protein PilQ n=1 Tax=Crenothrix polyspora TaxID=360316 RepID=A0A1R4HCK1_9GAMM|nr:type IV pilus secretin family protein [Crenothrix polyspora]SJM93953.1 Fimbrial assembly protein PilQ [Crenothrix polyspora]
MENKQGGTMVNMTWRFLRVHCWIAFLLLFQMASVAANELAISNIDVATVAGDKLQIQLELNGPAVTPKVFHTDNPARIAIDLVGVKSALAKKMYPINQGSVTSVYVAEAADRIRIVVNMMEATPFETTVEGNKILLTLNGSGAVSSGLSKPHYPERSSNSAMNTLMPEQAINGFDFKRGDNGEGRILVSLANPNTIVNSREEGGKVVVSFVNTRLPENLAKRLDVSEFATPVKTIDATMSSRETTVTVSLQNNLYDYSLFQSDGLLTIEFRPLTSAEKEVLDSKRVKYTGDRLSLNFQDIDIRSVIAILAEFTGQNVVAGDEVVGTITLKLDDVPWDEALDFIMMTKALEKFETGNVTLIAPIGKIKEYKEKQRETEKVVEQLDPLITEYIKINYARAENFRNLLNGLDTGAFGSCGSSKSSGGGSSGSSSNNSAPIGMLTVVTGGQNQQGTDNSKPPQNEQFRILSSRGSAVVDARTNTLIIRETAKRLEEAKKLIRRLDVPVRQVMIESRIVIATNKFAKEMGVKFGTAGFGSDGSTQFGIGGRGTKGTPQTGTTNFNIDEEGKRTETTTGEPAKVEFNDMLVDLGAAVGAGSGGALALTLVKGADYVLNLELSALQDQGLGELVSNPRVMTSDRCQATIKQGVQIPYQTVSQNGTQTQLVDAALQLDVLPQITPSGSVVMQLKITKDAPGAITPDGVGIDTRQISTNVHVMDGETVVLGGVFEGTQQNNTNKIPFFADLPGVGFLFKKTFKQDDKTELLIFVTPKIITDNTIKD